ncbi:alpha/beta hydrolase [Neobacillus sp. MM2021_6]|uniref:alpha/beta fold hydrolase n=1 Tax=Bacillaceae TaxID=186817 RepID=UPI00140BF179|nr:MULTISPECIES: alpha/beta hydrolase [Bacillaceae]MBO0958461.1 alpha/beta hydrolase [Neobacillus sp. MM2021_6]NHC20721.1 alpha/beta hydrolase [Bacillus sp. MM2020_4]
MSNSAKLINLGSFAKDTVQSLDRTTIGYRYLGKGPGILIIHGALCDSKDYIRLAKHLSQNFSVYIMDRRGRGLSGVQGENYGMVKEIEDIQAVRAATGANMIIGHSYGGLVALEAARQDDTIEKLALYEPGVFIEQQHWQWLTNYEMAMKQNEYREAFAHFVRGIGHTPQLTNLPKWYVKFILKMMIRGQYWDKIVSMLPENLNEHREVQRLSGTYNHYRSIKAKTLLMVGGKSIPFVKQTTQELGRTILECHVLTIPKTDHFGLDNDHFSDEAVGHLHSFFYQG